MLIKQVHQNSAIFVTIGISKIIVLNFHQMSAMFHRHKRSTSIKNVDVIKIVVSNKVSFWKKGFKYFIGYKDTKKNKPLCIFLP